MSSALSPEEVLAEAGALALEARFKDRVIVRQAAELDDLRAEAAVLRAEAAGLYLGPIRPVPDDGNT
jgi:hypothetical protein